MLLHHTVLFALLWQNHFFLISFYIFVNDFQFAQIC